MSIVFEVKRSRNLGNMTLRRKVEWDNRLAQYASDIILVMQVEIETPKWFRGGDAYRWGGGGRVFSPAVDDIVDSGELRDSFSIVSTENRTGTSYNIVSSKADINAIRFGYMSKRSPYSKAKPTTKFVSRQIQGRDFVRSALVAYPPQKILQGAGSIRGSALGATNLSTAPVDINSAYAAYDDDIFG
jgi:hypothetical protein